MTIIDISLSVYQGMPVYPGNPEVHITEMVSQASKSVMSHMTFGSHTGTHIDAPLHAVPAGASLDTIPLEIFFGPCRVIDCTHDEFAVSRATLERESIQKDERILLKTRNSLRGYDVFHPNFIFVSPEAAEYLSTRVMLIGIDYLSIKQKGSPDNRPHTYFLEKNIPILEGIDLSNVSAGRYTLVAFPLRLRNGDGAPTRAVLIT